MPKIPCHILRELPVQFDHLRSIKISEEAVAWAQVYAEIAAATANVKEESIWKLLVLLDRTCRNIGMAKSRIPVSASIESFSSSLLYVLKPLHFMHYLYTALILEALPPGIREYKNQLTPLLQALFETESGRAYCFKLACETHTSFYSYLITDILYIYRFNTLPILQQLIEKTRSKLESLARAESNADLPLFALAPNYERALSRYQWQDMDQFLWMVLMRDLTKDENHQKSERLLQSLSRLVFVTTSQVGETRMTWFKFADFASLLPNQSQESEHYCRLLQSAYIPSDDVKELSPLSITMKMFIHNTAIGANPPSEDLIASVSAILQKIPCTQYPFYLNVDFPGFNVSELVKGLWDYFPDAITRMISALEPDLRNLRIIYLYSHVAEAAIDKSRWRLWLTNDPRTFIEKLSTVYDPKKINRVNISLSSYMLEHLGACLDLLIQTADSRHSRNDKRSCINLVFKFLFDMLQQSQGSQIRDYLIQRKTELSSACAFYVNQDSRNCEVRRSQIDNLFSPAPASVVPVAGVFAAATVKQNSTGQIRIPARGQREVEANRALLYELLGLVFASSREHRFGSVDLKSFIATYPFASKLLIKMALFPGYSNMVGAFFSCVLDYEMSVFNDCEVIIQSRQPEKGVYTYQHASGLRQRPFIRLTMREFLMLLHHGVLFDPFTVANTDAAGQVTSSGRWITDGQWQVGLPGSEHQLAILPKLDTPLTLQQLPMLLHVLRRASMPENSFRTPQYQKIAQLFVDACHRLTDCLQASLRQCVLPSLGEPAVNQVIPLASIVTDSFVVSAQCPAKNDPALFQWNYLLQHVKQAMIAWCYVGEEHFVYPDLNAAYHPNPSRRRWGVRRIVNLNEVFAYNGEHWRPCTAIFPGVPVPLYRSAGQHARLQEIEYASGLLFDLSNKVHAAFVHGCNSNCLALPDNKNLNADAKRALLETAGGRSWQRLDLFSARIHLHYARKIKSLPPVRIKQIILDGLRESNVINFSTAEQALSDYCQSRWPGYQFLSFQVLERLRELRQSHDTVQGLLLHIESLLAKGSRKSVATPPGTIRPVKFGVTANEVLFSPMLLQGADGEVLHNIVGIYVNTARRSGLQGALRLQQMLQEKFNLTMPFYEYSETSGALNQITAEDLRQREQRVEACAQFFGVLREESLARASVSASTAASARVPTSASAVSPPLPGFTFRLLSPVPVNQTSAFAALNATLNATTGPPAKRARTHQP